MVLHSWHFLQAILEHLDLNSKRNARLTNKAFGKIVRSALGSVRCRLPKHAALAASTVAKRLHRLFDTLPDIRSVQLHFIAEESINLLDEEAASPVDDWALQVEHTKLAMALGTLKHLNKLSLHSADQIPLVPYCSLTQLKSLDISHCNFPHQLLQLIPRSLKQLTELLLDMAGPRQETLLQAQDIASLCGLTNLQHLQLGNMTSSTSIPGQPVWCENIHGQRAGAHVLETRRSGYCVHIMYQLWQAVHGCDAS